MKTFRTVLLLGILFTAGNAFCEEPGVDLNTIVVTPSRIEEAGTDTPYTVDVISGKEARQSYPMDLSGVLDALPSVYVSNYGWLGQAKNVRMRGASTSEVLVMVDGRPVISPRDGMVDLGTIPLPFVDRVEVVHGPGSSLYGSSAMGGTINILTKNPPRKPRTEITSLAGTHETFIERFSQGATAGKFGYILTSEYGHTKGFRDNSIADEDSADAKLTYALTDASSVNLSAGYFNSRAGTPGLVTLPDNDDRQLDYKNFIDAGWKLDAGEGLRLSVRTYKNYEQLRFFENSAGAPWDTAGDRFRHTTVSNGFGTQATREFNDRYTGTAGFDYTGNLNNSSNGGKHTYNVRAGFLQNIVNVTEQARLNFGARLDDYSTFGTKLNPNAGAVYSFNRTDRIRASISTAFRAPTFNDLYWPFDGWAQGNPTLQPEKSITVETGIDKQITKKVFSSATYFHNRFRNLINWQTVGFLSTPSNIGSAQIDGVELSTTIRITDALGCNLNYTYQRPLDRASKTDLVYQPRHKAGAKLAYADKNLQCELNAEYNAKRFGSPGDTNQAKQFFVCNFSLEKPLTPNVNILLNLNNILNRRYEVIKDYPSPGFAVLAGAKVTF
jgi:outer membrane cobalamin receptor